METSPERHIHKEREIREKFHPMVEFGLDAKLEVFVGDLKEQIQERGGQVLILMHPFYEDVAGLLPAMQGDSQQAQGLRSTLEIFDTAIELWLSDMKKPTIILEQRDFMNATADRCVAKEIVPNRNIYTIPTVKKNGTPFFPFVCENVDTMNLGVIHPAVIENHREWVGRNGYGKEYQSAAMRNVDNSTTTLSWAVLHHILVDSLGVKKVFLGGKYIDVVESENGDFLGKCLGEAYNYMDLLSHSFKEAELEVVLSDAIFPATKEGLKGTPLLRKGGIFEE